jgi:hypothetical protein
MGYDFSDLWFIDEKSGRAGTKDGLIVCILAMIRLESEDFAVETTHHAKKIKFGNATFTMKETIYKVKCR